MEDAITFSPEDAKGNPRAAMIRVEPVKGATYGNQRAHDLRIGPQPYYVDPDRVCDNRILIAPPTTPELRSICEARRSQRDTQRALKSNARIGVRAVLGFGSEAAQIFEQLSPDDQDAAILEVGYAVAAEAKTTLVGVVVHNDEATVHAHFSFVGFDLEGQPLTETMRRGMTTRFQDIVAEVMGRHAPGIERGHSKWDRIKAGASYAETVHKSVQELHRTLPADLEKKRIELDEVQARVDEMQKRVDETSAKLDAKSGEDEKLSKRLALYEKRLADRRVEATSIKERMSELKVEIARLADREKAVEHGEKIITQRIENLDVREATLDARARRLDAQEIAQDQHDDDLDRKAEDLNQREDQLATREDALSKREALVERIVAQATELIDGIAEKLGVKRGFEALKAAVSSMHEHRETYEELDDPFSAPEEPREETDGPGF